MKGDRFQVVTMVLMVLLWISISFSALGAQNVTIEGTVILEGSEARTVPVRLNTGGYRGSASGGGMENEDPISGGILVWLEDQNTDARYEDRDTVLQVLDQVDKQFQPRLMAVRAGDVVRIKNSDPLYHNVFSLSRTKRFDVGRRSPNEYKDVLFDRAGIVDVFCDIHLDMHAVIQVLPTETLAWQKLEDSGSFRFTNVPQGEYTLHFLALGNRSYSMDVNAARIETVTVETVRL